MVFLEVCFDRFGDRSSYKDKALSLEIARSRPLGTRSFELCPNKNALHMSHLRIYLAVI